jgi:hypothetical protein
MDFTNQFGPDGSFPRKSIVQGVGENRTGSLVLDRRTCGLERERAIGQFSLLISARHRINQRSIDTSI